MRVARVVTLTSEERAVLTKWSRGRSTPADLDLHLIVDNYATHKHPKVKSWLKRHPRFHIHFTPTSSSWLNVIERWFRDITQNLFASASSATYPN